MRLFGKNLVLVLMLVCFAPGHALETKKLSVKRKDVFAFTEKPSLSQDGDRVTVRFALKDYCDVTVAIEHQSGKILRHLASGVLGDNAPVPYQKNSLKQELVWDGKDEIGKYVDNLKECRVRISLGLKARLERNLYWSPHKALSTSCPPIQATREGVYVWFAGHVNQLRLFDHDGNYVRTVYPFPADKIKHVKGLKWQSYPPDNESLPSKLSNHDQDTLLPDESVRALAVRGKRIVLAGLKSTFLATDGSSGGMSYVGPTVGYESKGGDKGSETAFRPYSAALGPDGKRLYLSCYSKRWSYNGHAARSFLHGVNVIELDGDPKPKLFAGLMKSREGTGSDNNRFRVPLSVACDAQGRVYVADNLNNRIQVYDRDGKFLKSIFTDRPGIVKVHPKTGEIWVISSNIACHIATKELGLDSEKWKRYVPEIRVFGPLAQPHKKAVYPLEVPRNDFSRMFSVYDAVAEIDFATDPPTIWSAVAPNSRSDMARTGIRLWQIKGKKLVLKRNFNAETRNAVLRDRRLRHGRRRLFVNPVTGRVYIGEHTVPTQVACKSFHEMPQLDPETGKLKMVQLPTDAEDLDFDWEGRAYLRAYNAITRFDYETWREVPFDYGEERMVYHGQGGGGEKPYMAVSALKLPSVIGGMFHLGGMSVSPQGDIVVSCINPNSAGQKNRKKTKNVQQQQKVAYTAPVYPGRFPGWEIHIFDIHGQLVRSDALPGLNHTTKVRIDRNRKVFALAAGAPFLDGKQYFNGRGCTLIKATPGKAKTLSVNATIPLSPKMRPKRSVDLARPGLWVQNAEWLFGPVGAEGHYGSGGHCSCYVNGTFDLDYFGRTFASEVDRFRVVVLDPNGNVILRIGRYGNVDDGMPLIIPDPTLKGKQGAQPLHPRSIGGDEVALMHAQNLALHSDRRLFIADVGNECVRSVKLEYHVSEFIPLRRAKIAPQKR